MRSLAAYALYRWRLRKLSLRDDPSIKQLAKQIPAKRSQHKRVYADIRGIRTAIMGVQFEREVNARRQEREDRKARFRAQLFGGV